MTSLDLERALAELPEDFRSVLLLADLEGLALHEIGQIMDIPIGTVKSRLFRARRMVRRRLADYRTGMSPSMNCHQVRDLFEEHRRRELAPDLARAVAAHLEDCPACRGHFARDDALVALIRPLPRAPAPPGLATPGPVAGRATPANRGLAGTPVGGGRARPRCSSRPCSAPGSARPGVPKTSWTR